MNKYGIAIAFKFGFGLVKAGDKIIQQLIAVMDTWGNHYPQNVTFVIPPRYTLAEAQKLLPDCKNEYNEFLKAYYKQLSIADIDSESGRRCFMEDVRKDPVISAFCEKYDLVFRKEDSEDIDGITLVNREPVEAV